MREFHEKQVRFLLEAEADIVGLQETTEDHALRLGKALGFYCFQSSKSVGILSRYPIVAEYGEITRAAGVRIDLNGGRKPGELNFWNIHTGGEYREKDFASIGN